MADSEIIKIYSGKEPYVFFSYAHADMAKVLPVIRRLDEKKYRLWYDAGIEAGANWPEVVASHLLNSGTVLFFVSEKFIRSQNCMREVNYAVSEKKKMCYVLLDDVKLPQDLAMQLSTVVKLPSNGMSADEIGDSIISFIGEEYLGDGVTGYEKIEKEKAPLNIWRVLSLIFAGLLLVSLFFIFGYFNNWFSFAGIESNTISDQTGQQLEVTKFKDSVSRNVLLKAYDGSSLYLCGDYMVSDAGAIRYKEGRWYVGEDEVTEGDFSDLSIISSKENITYLSLVNENISDISELKKMDQLVYLDLSSNPINDLSVLSELKDLQYLKLIDVNINDYSFLKELSNLKYLYVTYDVIDEVLNYIDTSKVDLVVKK